MRGRSSSRVRLPPRSGVLLDMYVPSGIRRWVDPLSERIPLPVISGPNRGRWWNAASAGSGYVTGRRAREQMALLNGLISRGDIVWDVGAHHGYVTMFASERAGADGWVYAFEPGRRNSRILARHIRWNGLDNVSVHDCALASYSGRARFGGGPTSKMHALGKGEDDVTVWTAEDLVQSGTVQGPTFMKIDVEGSEADVLSGALPVLPSDVVILVAVHSVESDRACTVLLRDRGFELIPSAALKQARNQEWHADPDLLCVGPDCKARDRLRRLYQSGCS